MNARHRPKALVLAGGVVQPGVAFGGVAPEQTGEMRDPRDIDLGALERLEQRIGRCPRDVAPGIGTEEGVAVDAHQSEGNAPAGKMRAAFFQRTSAISSCESSASR